jgi:glycosyltransferase involved in cell wall biosynthesis
MAWKTQRSRPAKALFMVHQLRAGGSERQMAEVAKSVDRMKIQPFVGVLRPNDFWRTELDAAQVPVHCFNVQSFASPRIVPDLWRFRRYLRTERIDLVHAFDTPGNVFGALGGRWAGVPVVLTSQRAHRSLSPPGQLQVLRWSDRFVDGIVVNCDYIRRHMIDDECVPEERIHLCYNGIDTAMFRPSGETARTASPDRVTVGVICALRPEKDLNTLLTGFALARRQRPEMQLLVVGSGAELPALEQQARELELGADCTFVPDQNNVASWLRTIDIFVLPSRTEALSNSLMEAMACGCAVVASEIGGNPELVETGRTGMLFPSGQPESLAQALRQLTEDVTLRQRLAKEAAQLIPHRFSLAASVNRMQQIYESFLGPAE